MPWVLDPLIAEICDRKLYPEEGKTVCKSPDLCFEYVGEAHPFVRCGPCSLKLAGDPKRPLIWKEEPPQ